VSQGRLYAERSIPRGEEVVVDYERHFPRDGTWGFNCSCRDAECRRVIGAVAP
jgi:hypothetical protein